MTTAQTNRPGPVGESKNLHCNASIVHTMQLPFAFPKCLLLLKTALVSIRGCYWH
jgi:hypothetical protein